MNTFAIERNGSLVNHIIFRGNGLYRSHDILPLTFSTYKAALEIAEAIDGAVVDYQLYLSQQRMAA